MTANTVTIAFVPGAEPVTGWLDDGSTKPREFVGMLELMDLLERARHPDDERFRREAADGDV